MGANHYRYVLATALAATAACVNPLAPERARFKDPGTLAALVRDTAGSPMAGVWVYVELPNDVGSFFWEGTPTRDDGKTTFHYVPAGTRTVEVRPPAGYVTVDGHTKREILVVKGKTATIEFTLRRN